ncbi:MAG TPA: F0F1 ATP synthase subunit A [Mycobacteriales bacterium]|nr:F0F1 ATP synthase subunit A [Mycobacteriales bacterium]
MTVLGKAGEEFTPPSSRDFELPEIFGDGTILTKPMLLVLLSTVIIAVFFYAAARRAAIVPGKLQFAGEGVYGFVRDGVARDVIGPDFLKFVPYLVTLFSFIVVNNVFGIIPVIQFPPMSRIAFPAVLAIISWLVFNYIGVRRKGAFRYFKDMMFPPGVPKPVYLLLAPIEFVSTVVVRPLTLALRLFANMFAGHLLLLVFILGGEHLLVSGGLLAAVSIPAFLLGIVLTFFELLVQVLQAYIFTLLTALYIAGALADEH